MKREPPMPGGDLERTVLGALWDLGEASTRDLHESVGVPAGLVYTTTAKVLDRLHAKGLVMRQKQGRVFVYRAAVPRSVVERARTRESLGELLRMNKPKPAIATLVDAVEAIDPALLDDLAREVAARRRSRRGP